MRLNSFARPKSISSQSLVFGEPKVVQRLAGVGLKLIAPSLTIFSLSKREVKEADALGKILSPGLRARFLAGAASGVTGSVARPQTSNSVRPTRPLGPCVKTARIFEVSTWGKCTTFARCPVGSRGERVCAGTVAQASPVQYCNSNLLGSDILLPSSSR